MIVPELRKIQSQFGYLPDLELKRLAERIDKKLHHLHEVITFFPHFRLQPPPVAVLRVCRDMACHLGGAQASHEIIKAVAGEFGLEVRESGSNGKATGALGNPVGRAGARGEPPPWIEVGWVSCLGQCDGAPAITVELHKPGTPDQFHVLTTRDPGEKDIATRLRSLLDPHLKGGKVPSHAVDHSPLPWKIDPYHAQPDGKGAEAGGKSSAGFEPYSAARGFARALRQSNENQTKAIAAQIVSESLDVLVGGLKSEQERHPDDGAQVQNVEQKARSLGELAGQAVARLVPTPAPQKETTGAQRAQDLVNEIRANLDKARKKASFDKDLRRAAREAMGKPGSAQTALPGAGILAYRLDQADGWLRGAANDDEHQVGQRFLTQAFSLVLAEAVSKLLEDAIAELAKSSVHRLVDEAGRLSPPSNQPEGRDPIGQVIVAAVAGLVGEQGIDREWARRQSTADLVPRLANQAAEDLASSVKTALVEELTTSDLRGMGGPAGPPGPSGARSGARANEPTRPISSAMPTKASRPPSRTARSCFARPT
jgi:NADH:ubiquinone oxidoreductase subunit E